MSLTIIKSAIINRIKTPGIVYQGDAIPIIDPAATSGDALPDLHITHPLVAANFILQKRSFNYRGTAILAVFALISQYGDGVTLDVCELIRGCMWEWKPPQVATFLPAEIDEQAQDLSKYRSASIRFDWIA